jgi:uncharacterized coiled-coil DUF342 family protein
MTTESQTREQIAAQMRAVCDRIDELNEQLDEQHEQFSDLMERADAARTPTEVAADQAADAERLAARNHRRSLATP